MVWGERAERASEGPGVRNESMEERPSTLKERPLSSLPPSKTPLTSFPHAPNASAASLGSPSAPLPSMLSTVWLAGRMRKLPSLGVKS